MSINCVIIDDEFSAIELLESYISRISFLEIARTFDSANEAINYLNSYSVDLVFVDIEMPNLNGFDLIGNLINKPYTIITSACDQYALKAFDMAINDYILKPISLKRFLSSVNRAKTQIEKDRMYVSNNFNSIHIRSGRKTEKVLVNDILFIKGMGDYLLIYTKIKRILTLMTFDEMKRKLPSKKFLRIHKSYIIPFDKIDQIYKDKVKIDRTDIPIGRTFKDKFFCKVAEMV